MDIVDTAAHSQTVTQFGLSFNGVAHCVMYVGAAALFRY